MFPPMGKDFAHTTDDSDASDPDAAGIDRTSLGAIVALTRAMELHDPNLARVGALRAAVILHCAPVLGLSKGDVAHATAAALVADVAAIVTHARAGDRTKPDGVAEAVLGAALLDRITNDLALGEAVRHRFESWDGSGGPANLQGHAIPITARLLAVAAVLVGAAGSVDDLRWNARALRLQSTAGDQLDPDLVEACAVRLQTRPFDEPGPSLIDEVLDTLDDLTRVAARDTPIESLTAIATAIHAADRIDDLLTLIVSYTCSAVGASTVGVTKIDQRAHRATEVAWVGELDSGERRTSRDLGDFPLVTAFHTGETHLLVTDQLVAGSTEAQYLQNHNSGSEIGVPITVDGEFWGVLHARTRSGLAVFADRSLSTLRLAAAQISTTIEQSTRFSELERLALRDPLTGLGNRRVLDTTLHRIFRRPPVARQDCAVIICDVDELKVVNDTEGHAAGDRVLIDAAAALIEAVSDIPTATVCRIGGDEFCVVIDGGGSLLGVPVAETAQRNFASRGEGRSMSCGVAIATLEIAAPGDLLRAADTAQYQQKRLRRSDDDGSTRPGRRARRDR